MADIRSVKGSYTKAPDEHVENLRQKIGSEFSDKKTIGKKKNELGKDDFMKLMSAQLKYQDPINPLKNEEMAAQLAQFSALEQMMNVNQNLEKMAAGQKPQENMMAANLIGKKVVSDASILSLKKGESPQMKFDLAADADKISISVVDAKGEILRQYDLNSMKSGTQFVKWDGRNSKGLEVSPGEYSFRVTATDANNQQVQAKTTTSGLVNGVVFESGRAMLLVDDKKLPLEAVSRIEIDQAGPKKPAEAGNNNVNKMSEDKQEKFTSPAKGDSEKISQIAEKILPGAAKNEKINTEGGVKSGELAQKQSPTTDSSEARGENGLPYPLWNPQTQAPTEFL